MNKVIAAMAVGVLVTAAGLVYACGMDADDDAMGGKPEMKGMMHHGMMSGMMGRSVVATSDGGIVILEGNSILKYDRNLKLVNEAKLTGGMPLEMKKKGGCGCKMKGMDHKMMDNDGDDDMDKTVGNKGNINQGHEAHH